MKYLLICFLLPSIFIHAQETVLPAQPHKGSLLITQATVHTGTGQVLEGASVLITDGRIMAVGQNISAPAGTQIIDASGKHVYPGLIAAVSNLGLVEISAVRATSDVREIGDMNPTLRAIVAYNTDSRVINTLRSNGVLLANIVPQGSFVAGQSSVVHLDAWNWEEAVYRMDGGLHVYMPSMMPAPRFRNTENPDTVDPVKQGLEQLDRLKSFLREAKAYHEQAAPKPANLLFESVKGLFSRQQKLFFHANTVKQMLVALDIGRELGTDIVIVGGMDSWQITGLLKEYNVPVILSQPHSLPVLPDDHVDQPYKTAAMLAQAGVLFAISDDDAMTRGRNLPFNAGTAAAYGLTREQALQAITLNAARILGIDSLTGSIEPGKDANIIISEGDILDMRTSVVTDAFIQGRRIDLTDRHKLLQERYEIKYGQKAF